VSEGEERHPGWVLEHLGRATFGVRAATIFILPKAEDVQIYLRGVSMIRGRSSGHFRSRSSG